jgi:hypothetical protein
MTTTTRIACFALLLSSVPAFADDDDMASQTQFYDQKITIPDPNYHPAPPDTGGVRNWHIFGGPKKGHLYCKAQISSADGSYVIIGQDFTNPETGMYFYIHNTQWDILPTSPGAPWPSDKQPLAMKVQTNAYAAGGRPVHLAELNAKAFNKNSVEIPKLDPKDVYRILSRAFQLRFIMPNNISNLTIGGFSPQLATKLTECFDIVRKQEEARKQHPEDNKDDAGESAFTGEKKAEPKPNPDDRI